MDLSSTPPSHRSIPPGPGDSRTAQATEDAASFRVREFRPAWWAPGPHLQTLAGRVLRPTVTSGLLRERWETPDGDFLDLDFSPEPDRQSGTASPLVLVLHGLEGSARRGYALVAYQELAARGIRSVGLNFRSCSGEPNRLPRAYHSGDTGDVAFVLDGLRERFPSLPLGVLGFSLGGNVLLKFLGERGEAARELITAAVAVSVPYDLAEGSRRLEGLPMGRVYSTYFLRSLRRKTRLKANLLRDRISLEKTLAAATLRDFDDLATAPLHGFDSAAQYYESSSSQHYLSRLRVPTLLLHAGDDPFLPHVALPHRAIQGNPAITSGVVGRGGHVGFVEGSPFSPRFWAESEAARFMETILTEGASGASPGNASA